MEQTLGVAAGTLAGRLVGQALVLQASHNQGDQVVGAGTEAGQEVAGKIWSLEEHLPVVFRLVVVLPEQHK